MLTIIRCFFDTTIGFSATLLISAVTRASMMAVAVGNLWRQAKIVLAPRRPLLTVKTRWRRAHKGIRLHRIDAGIIDRTLWKMKLKIQTPQVQRNREAGIQISFR